MTLILSKVLPFAKIFQRFYTTCSAMDSGKSAIVLIANGTEEIEVTAAVDILRRADVDVTLGGVDIPKGMPVKASREVKIMPDVTLPQVLAAGLSYDAVVLPGGLGGTEVFSCNEDVGQILKCQEENNKIVAAICAAPLALKKHGIYTGKSLTSYPSVENDLSSCYQYKTDPVVVDGNLVTSRGPGTAMLFALALVEKLVSKEKATEIAKGMLVENYK